MIRTLLLLLSAGKLGAVLKSGGTMVVSVFAYALLFGWWYAVGFVLLILVHEMGHYVAARLCGLPVGLPTFIPFVGAWIQMDRAPTNVHTEAYVGIAGPIFGTAAALAVLAAANASDSMLLLALAYAGFMINLFNLLPVTPLDGGRIVAIVSPRIWLLGLPLLGLVFLWYPSPILILVMLLAAPSVWSAWRAWRRGETGRYYDVPNALRVRYAGYYLALLVFLALMAFRTHERLMELRPVMG